MKKLIILYIFLINSAQANLIIVDSNTDEINNDEFCNLREALISANFDTGANGCTAGLGDDLIWMLGLNGSTIEVGSQLPIIDGVEIQGPGVDGLVIKPTINYDGAVFQINTDDDVTFNDFNIEDARSGAIDVVDVGDLTLSDMKLLNNHAASGSDGGGLYLNNTDPTLDYNHTILIENSLFEGNHATSGAAILIFGEYVLEVNNSQFINNQADNFGAAISKRSNELLLVGRSADTINQSQFINNNGSSVLSSNLQQIEITQSTFYQNNVDYVFYNFSSFGTVSNSLFAENTGTTTIYNNSSTQSGVPQSELTFSFNSFVENNGTAIVSVRNSIAYIQGNVFSDQLGCSNGSNQGQPTGLIISNGYNLENNNHCASHATDMTFTDALLMPTGDYGGQILAPPSPISPLVDSASTACSNLDLSGEGRPRDGDGSGGLGQCDIGAVERPNAYGLSLSLTGNGSGEVYLAEFELSCHSPETCLWPLPRNETFSFTPSADSGNTFISWDNSCQGDMGCDVTMDGFKFLSAEFASVSNPVTLSVTKFFNAPDLSALITSAPAGINCGSNCSADYLENDLVVLSASLGEGSVIDTWSGCDSIQNDDCHITMGNSQANINLFVTQDPDIIFKANFE